MRILVTGGAGYIGSHVSNLLIENGYKVSIIDNLITGNKILIPKQAELFECDIADENKVESVIDSKNVQSVSLDINGEKYKLLSPDFKAGSKVRNVLTNEIGTVMGSFYVSIEEKMELNKLNTRFKIKPLSNDTFEFIPLDRKAHLIGIYKELKLTPEFLHVEMNIMFLGSHDGDIKKQF